MCIVKPLHFATFGGRYSSHCLNPLVWSCSIDFFVVVGKRGSFGMTPESERRFDLNRRSYFIFDRTSVSVIYLFIYNKRLFYYLLDRLLSELSSALIVSLPMIHTRLVWFMLGLDNMTTRLQSWEMFTGQPVTCHFLRDSELLFGFGIARQRRFIPVGWIEMARTVNLPTAGRMIFVKVTALPKENLLTNTLK